MRNHQYPKQIQKSIIWPRNWLKVHCTLNQTLIVLVCSLWVAGTRGPEESQGAVRNVRTVLEGKASKLHLVCVVPTVREDVITSIVFSQVDYEFVSHFEKPGEFIVSESRRRAADYIVTGTRGMGKLRKTLLGSVSDYVLHHAHCPVLICRSEKDFSK